MESVVQLTTHLLLDSIARSNEGPDSAALQLLTVIFQRHGPIFSEASSKLLATVEDGDDLIGRKGPSSYCSCKSVLLMFSYISQTVEHYL